MINNVHSSILSRTFKQKKKRPITVLRGTSTKKPVAFKFERMGLFFQNAYDGVVYIILRRHSLKEPNVNLIMI